MLWCLNLIEFTNLLELPSSMVRILAGRAGQTMGQLVSSGAPNCVISDDSVPVVVEGRNL